MLSSESTRVKLRVIEKNEVADNIIQMTFTSANGRALSSWSPGSHLELHLPSGLMRHYSLCGAQQVKDAYTVAVLRDANGRGGSIEVHDMLQVGDEIFSSEPRNHFPLVEAGEYVLLAGGIGITPIKAMIEELEQRSASWRLVYGGRSRSTMAFSEELIRLYGERVSLVPQDEAGRPDLAKLIESFTPDTVMYCCGPAPMLDAARAACEAAGAADRLHIERFSAGDEPVSTAGEGFTVELASTGEAVQVAENQSILDAIRAVRSNVPSSCQEGYCGTCETRVLAGQPEHRGSLMSPEEHDAEGTMLICVGRSRSEKLVLDL